MTDRAEIERMLNQTGRTLECIPNKHSMAEIADAARRPETSLEVICHQSDLIELLVGVLRDALDKRQKWISVEERLPETCGIYLAHIVHRYCKVDSYSRVAVEYFSADREWDSLPDLYEVTHWMPLPEPPNNE